MADLACDYELETATVRHLRVERAGTRLTAFLQLAVARTYASDESARAQPALHTHRDHRAAHHDVVHHP
ncbi:hypothetical protein OTB20_11875 [Streptomyces sp. H27-H1]|uniref:hypothetical protein n=1 Tax=Streptomyces sp. H27-H1 TaxID=2996461 RepID=UPI00227028FF|nr:hypothetical protein [Streptomyces sp. H27-H1]MCY0926888.1 hypothetical protein [Streptomyces sp. H27-H1]